MKNELTTKNAENTKTDRSLSAFFAFFAVKKLS